jgi:hypothetical protein
LSDPPPHAAAVIATTTEAAARPTLHLLRAMSVPSGVAVGPRRRPDAHPLMSCVLIDM